MPLVSKTDTERVELSTPGEWVDLKRRLSKGDRTELMSLAAQFRVGVSETGEMSASDVNMDVAVVLDALTFRGLEIGIMAWSFDEPLNPANIRLLSEEDYDIIKRRCDALWAGRTEDEGKNLAGNGATPSSVEAPYQTVSNGSP